MVNRNIYILLTVICASALNQSSELSKMGTLDGRQHSEALPNWDSKCIKYSQAASNIKPGENPRSTFYTCKRRKREQAFTLRDMAGSLTGLGTEYRECIIV